LEKTAMSMLHRHVRLVALLPGKPGPTNSSTHVQPMRR
jgi:hypothetical protein